MLRRRPTILTMPPTMPPDERAFFQTVGSRIARCRKEAVLNQAGG